MPLVHLLTTVSKPCDLVTVCTPKTNWAIIGELLKYCEHCVNAVKAQPVYIW